MSFLPGVPTKTLTEFDGAVLRLDPLSVPPNNGLYAQNCAYLHGSVGKRYGHSLIGAISDGPVTSMANWVMMFSSTPVSIVLYYAAAVGLRALNQIAQVLTTIMTVTGASGAVTANAGQRTYAAFYNSTGRLGFAGGQVYGWNIGADPLFAAPLTNTPTCSETGAGLMTAGIKRIGYITTTRNGYTGALQPVDGSNVFAPVAFNCTGNRNLQVSIPGTFPSYFGGGTTALQIVATTASNLNQYFTVPGAVQNVLTNPTTITISISDDDLAATGQDVTANMNLLTSNGIFPPFNPIAVFTYSNRMCYVAIDKFGIPVLYVSDQNNYQSITADQHAIYMEGQAEVINGMSLRGVCYIGTLFGFYSTQDNGDVPATWTPPQLVDGSVGILAPDCLMPNPSLGYALVASPRGFYLFQGGIFPALPLSYYQQPDWARINWLVPTVVKIIDDQLNKRFIVLVPLNNAVQSFTGSGPFLITTTMTPHQYQVGLTVKIAGLTSVQTIATITDSTFTVSGAGGGTPTLTGSIQPQTASHRMSWDYTEGDTAETAKYSLDSFEAYLTGAGASIQNITNNLKEVWYAPATNGAIIRQNDGSEAHPYRDLDTTGVVPFPVDTIWETALIPGEEDATTIHYYHGAQFRLTGSGNVGLVVYNLDGTQQVVPRGSPLALTAKPGQIYMAKWFLASEQSSIQFRSNGLDDWFTLNLIEAAFTATYSQR